MNFFKLGFVLFALAVFSEGARNHWRASQQEAETAKIMNVRGFIGCENGNFVIRDFDISLPMDIDPHYRAFNFPDTNSCAKQ